MDRIVNSVAFSYNYSRRVIKLKLIQIEYALAVAKAGSFTQAAKELFVSQPSISYSINSLESELGFHIFERTTQGVTITIEGKEFLNHANNIIDEMNYITRITEDEPFMQFSIGNMFNHTSVSQAFLKLCNSFENNSKYNFALHTGSTRDIVEDVYQNKINLGIIVVNNIVLENYLNIMDNKNLHFEVIKNMNINVNLRAGHPLLENKPFDFTQLYDYPFVNYNFSAKTSNPASVFNDIASTGFINLEKLINVDEKETRRQLVLSSNAFSIGATYHPNMGAIDEIVSIQIPNLKMFLVLVFNKNRPSTEELNRFVELFMEELTKIEEF